MVLTPMADGGGAASGSSAIQSAVAKAALYVEPLELEEFAARAAELEEAISNVVGLLSQQRGFMMPGMRAFSMPSVTTFDGENLQLGAFEEAVKCREAFREGFYKPTVIEVNKVGNGHHVSGEVARRTCANYRNSDGDIAMDTQTLEREIDEAGRDADSAFGADSPGTQG
ncbi:hypothetical protein [Natronoglycomyces albus]|uniref:Uncharacterized protein n=1 Tax=Natronoglycomyces albus TaxID=2811108 RepID=A0A895XIG0_9ACTN|nr:hypothetical protein [Natronoglycomyces albus]QSB05124.1 hypothetical protein JQS30_15405 [Natronoglycomyces albus]